VSLGYALDLATPVRYVANALETAAPAAVSVAELVRGYRHGLPSDLHRVRMHEGCTSDSAANQWVVRKAISELRDQVVESEEGLRLAVPFEELRYQRRKVHRDLDAATVEGLDRDRAIKAAHNKIRIGDPVHVMVESARGSAKERRLRLHPLAMMLPLIPEKEFVELAEDVLAHGFTTPIHVLDDQVLDGRHRVALASALDLPIRVSEFVGSEQDARSFVISTNLRRRHLTTAQRTQLVRELYMPEATQQAAENKLRGNSRGGIKSTSVTAVDSATEPSAPKKYTKGKTAAEIAADYSGGLASARSIAAMAPVDKAPDTRARVMSGEIKTVDKARQAALIEIGSDDPSSLPPQLRGTWDAIGRAKYWVEQAISSQQAGVGLGVKRGGRVPVTKDEHLQRVAEIRALCDEYEAGLPEEDS